MSRRLVHRMTLFSDRDVLHTLIVAGAACVLSAGLVHVGYFLHVLRVARKAPCLPELRERLLLFGKHAPPAAATYGAASPLLEVPAVHDAVVTPGVDLACRSTGTARRRQC